jgi:diacylglycerol kinase family enzyme
LSKASDPGSLVEQAEASSRIGMENRMRRVALIENPASGSITVRRKRVVRNAVAALRGAGIEVEHVVLEGPGSGAALAREAIVRGCDAILVCGGDGTVHEILQAVVGTPVALGVLPLGTANALAANLGLAGSPDKAIRALIEARPVPVPVGRISYALADGSQQSRYFTVAAGVGPDALLMARMDPVLKRRLGYVLYLIEAFRIWVAYPFPLFEVRVPDGNGGVRCVRASQILAVRIRSFGGVLRRLAPGATLHSHDLSLVAFKTSSRLKYFRFLMAVIAGRHTFSRDVESIHARSVECVAGPDAQTPVYVEADGEVLGFAPVRMEMTEELLTLLVPPGAQP